MKKIRALAVFTLIFSVVVGLISGICTSNNNIIQIEDESIPMSSSQEQIFAKSMDENVIPDKYNSGVLIDESMLLKFCPDDTYGGIKFKGPDSNDAIKLDFAYLNTKISGKVTIENVDFSEYTIKLINSNRVARDIELSFVNCKFNCFSGSPSEDLISFKFTNCSFVHYDGSNSVFDRCYFGGTYVDALNLYNNVTLNDCYIADLAADLYNPENTAQCHSDGLQIYGKKGGYVSNISFTNCRFETPQLNIDGIKAYANACINVALEYCDADGINFTDCITNGGGYTLCAGGVSGLSVTNVYFNNVAVGCTKRWGKVYPHYQDGVEFSNIYDTDFLYIGSVFKDDSNTYLSVTNDTHKDRKLKIYTSSGNVYDFVVEKCPDYNEMQGMHFNELPFDVLYTIPENADWIVCYEVVGTQMNQIRFVNWTDKPVYLDTASEGTDGLLAEGSCGKNIDFVLNTEGVLTLTGSGATYDYESDNGAPWSDYNSSITEINIDENITKLGKYLFANCRNLETVNIPAGVVDIETGSFKDCTLLKSVYLPLSLRWVADYSFWNTSISNISYDGSAKQFCEIEIRDLNDDYLISYRNIQRELNSSENSEEDSDEQEPQENDNIDNTDNEDSDVSGNDEEETEPEDGGIYLSGICGENITFELNDGVLTLSGTGNTYNFNSNRRAPWYDYSDEIIQIIISEGIEKIGSQAFSNCINLEEISLPSTLVSLGSNSLMNCRSLTYLNIPGSLCSIGDYCFYGTSIELVTFEGTEEAAENIEIGNKNDVLKDSFWFYFSNDDTLDFVG